MCQMSNLSWVAGGGYRRLRQGHFLLDPYDFFCHKGQDGRWTFTQHQNKLVNAVVMYLVCHRFLFLPELPGFPEVPTAHPSLISLYGTYSLFLSFRWFCHVHEVDFSSGLCCPCCWVLSFCRRPPHSCLLWPQMLLSL